MTEGLDSNEKLLERLLLEVRAALPELDARPATAAQLRRRVGNLLGAVAPVPAVAERRPATILVAELRGFEALVEQFPPARVAELLRLLLHALQPVIERHEGIIYQLNGAVLTVAFGAPKPQSDHAVRALACAVELQQAIARCERLSAGLELPQVFMGIGVNSGEVLLGGTEITGRGYTLLGHVPALAARIAAQSLRGQVLIGESCYRLMNELILVGEATSLRVRTRHMPLTVYELLGTSRPRPLAVPRRESRSSPRVLVQMPCYFQSLASATDQLPVNAAELHCGQVVDFGYRGLRMISPVALPASGEIKMAVSLQMLGNRSSDIYARVVSSAAEQHGYRCGVEFTEIDLPARQVIKQFVDSQLGAV
jgi:adenylate cyclase